MAVRAAQAALACLGLCCAAAQAQLVPYCNNVAPQFGGAGGNLQCAATAVFVGDPASGTIGLVFPDTKSPGLARAEKVGTGSSPVFGASLAVAKAVASPGLLRAFSSAESLVSPGGIGNSALSATALASLDYGDVIGLPGARIGDPVSLRFVLDGAASFAYNGSVSVNFQLFSRWDVPVRGVALQLRRDQTTDRVTFDINFLRVGDHLSFLSNVTTQASVAAVFPGDVDLGGRYSAVDMLSTAHLYADVLSGNAQIVSASGHHYSLLAVPEPASWAMLALGLAGLLARAQLGRAAAGIARASAHQHRIQR